MHDQRIIWWEKWGMIYGVGKAWISERDDMVFYKPSYQKESRQIITIKHARGLGYITPPAQSQTEGDESLPLHSSSSSEWESDVSVGVAFKNLFVNITSISQPEQEEVNETFELSHGPSNSISSGRSDLNNVNRPLKIGWSRLMWVVKITLNPSL